MKLTPREPTPDMVEAERVKFEAWCAAKDINASYWLGDKRNGYNNGRVSDYWFGWKERAMHDAAPQPAALPEPDYKAGEKGMLGEDCYSAATVRAYGEACAHAALKGKQ